MSELVMACDPGGRSGWAEATMDVDRLELGEAGVLPMRDMGLWAAEQQRVGRLVNGRGRGDEDFTPRWGVMVIESWRPFPRDGSMNWIQGSNLIYAQHVGQVRLVADLSGAQIVMQEPRDKYNPTTKTVPPQAYPQAMLDIDALSSEQHDQDARYHLWVYFFRNWFTGAKEPNDCIV